MKRVRKFTEQIVVRVDIPLASWLRCDAEEHGRTVAQSVRFWLNESMRRENVREARGW